MHNKGILLFTIVAICIVGLVSCNSFIAVSWPTPSTKHSPSKISGLSDIWSLTNIYTKQDDFMPVMVARAGKVVFIGGMSNDGGTRLLCLDGSSGKVAWERVDSRYEERGYLSNISATSDSLYVGYGGVPSVKKLDLSTGEVLWSQSLSGR